MSIEMFDKMSELKWQKFNSILRIAMILLLIYIGYMLAVENSLDHCGQCKFVDSRCGGQGEPESQEVIEKCESVKKEVTCTEIMKSYAELIVEEGKPFSELSSQSIQLAMKDKYNFTI